MTSLTPSDLQRIVSGDLQGLIAERMVMPNGHPGSMPEPETHAIPSGPATKGEWALHQSVQGLRVFPVAPNKKKPPLITDFPNQATLDRDKIIEWWTQWPDANVGISTSHYQDDQALLIVDCDGPLGETNWQAWQAEHGQVPDTFEVETPRGMHAYFVVPKATKQGVSVLAPHVDHRSQGGYVLGPGSVVAGKVYTIMQNRPIAPAPAGLIAACGVPKAKPATPTGPPVDIKIDRSIERAIKYLTTTPIAIEGSGGDQCTYKVACRVKDEGVPEDQCVMLMLTHWNQKCQPPWSLEDLETKVSHAYRYGQDAIGSAAPEVEFRAPAEGVPDIQTTRYEFKQDWTDAGNANVMTHLADGNFKFVPETRTSMQFDGARWLTSRTRSLADRAALRVAEFYHAEIATLEALDKTLDAEAKKQNTKTLASLKAWEHRCRSKKSLDAMIALASTKPQIELSVTALDKNPYVLGVLNGVIDLQTEALRQAGRDEYVTIVCPVAYDPLAPAPLWEQTLAEVTGSAGATPDRYAPRPELVAYLQRVLGCAATGLTREHKMIIFNGPGSNGKNIVADAVRYVLGPYSTGLPSSCLLQAKFRRDGESPTPYAADLFRKRFVVSSETKAGFRLDTDFVKSQTGDTWQKARYLRENPFEFESSHKLFLMTNSLPIIDQLDEAIRGRLIVIPFDRTWNRPGCPDPNPALPMANETLPERLREEAPGILRWLVQGAGQYLAHGLGKPPDAVKTKTLDYLTDQDSLAQWIASCCERCDSHKDGATPTVLCEEYNHWAIENEAPSLSQREFSTGMKSRKFEAKDTWHSGRNQKMYPLRMKTSGMEMFE